MDVSGPTEVVDHVWARMKDWISGEGRCVWDGEGEEGGGGVAVERVVRMVEITPLPRASDILLGLINLHGRVVPVLDLRARFRIPTREIRPEDVLVIVSTPSRTVAVAADAVDGIAEYPLEAVVPDEKILPHMEHLAGVLKLPDGLVLICDPEGILSPDEVQALDGQPTGRPGAQEGDGP